MEPTDLTVQILREIRDAVRETSSRVDQTNARLDETNVRLGEVRDEVGRRIVESEIRTATAIAELAGAMQGVRDLLRDRLDLRDRVDRCEHEIELIKQRLDT